MAFFREMLSRWEITREDRAGKRRQEAVLQEAVRRVLHLSAAVVCTPRDCRRELRSPVENALGYIQRAIGAIPGPVPLAPDRWDRDPLLPALFVNPDEVKTLLAGDRRLKSFFRQETAAQACALLIATPKERTVFGTAVAGGIVQRDVAQTAVEFHDHRIIDPRPVAAETRRALEDRALNALVTQVLDCLLQARSLKNELKEQQRILSIQFEIQQTRKPGLGVPKPEDDGAGAPPAERPLLAEIERQIQDLAAESGSAEACVRQLIAALNAPQQVLTITPIVLRLNWMGVRQAADAGEGNIRLAEIELQGQQRRVAVLVDIDRRDCMPA